MGEKIALLCSNISWEWHSTLGKGFYNLETIDYNQMSIEQSSFYDKRTYSHNTGRIGKRNENGYFFKNKRET